MGPAQGRESSGILGNQEPFTRRRRTAKWGGEGRDVPMLGNQAQALLTLIRGKENDSIKLKMDSACPHPTLQTPMDSGTGYSPWGPSSISLQAGASTPQCFFL